MPPLPINQLILKGTHNSYSCNGIDWPWMNHPPGEQIDGFGVWAIELDFGFQMEGGQLRPKVGHDYAGHVTCWGGQTNDLSQFLAMVRNTAALAYRPVIIYLEHKTSWIVPPFIRVPQPGPAETSRLLEAELLAIFPLGSVFGPDALDAYRAEHDGRYPTVPELAGRIIPINANGVGGSALIFGPDRPIDFPARPEDHCTNAQDIENSIASGIRVFRLDQYQADWTFNYGVPPNPLVVDQFVQPPWTVTDSVGDEWDCDNGDVWRGQVVHEQGTYRLPFTTVGGAVTRAEGSPIGAAQDLRRAGHGWTVLIRPGNYRETLTISTPLTLRKDERYAGTVVIGG